MNLDAREYNDYPVIYRHEKRNRFIHCLEWIVIFVGTAILWFFFLRYLYHVLLGYANIERTIDIFIFLGVVFVIEIFVLGGWSLYNKLVYGKLNRRKGFPMMDDESFAVVYKVNLQQLQKLRRLQEVDVAENEEGLEWCIGDERVKFSDTKRIIFNFPQDEKYK